MDEQVSYTRTIDYKVYKNIQLKKKLDKANSLLSSINDSSLRKEDKETLKQRIIELFQTN